jgi:hypothetical protein
MATYKVVAFENKRYELYVDAENEEEAWDKADKTFIGDWENDCEYYNVDIDHVEKVDDE